MTVYKRPTRPPRPQGTARSSGVSDAYLDRLIDYGCESGCDADRMLYSLLTELKARRNAKNSSDDKLYAGGAKRPSMGRTGGERAILPLPCTNVKEATIKEWFAKIDEEMNELKEAVLQYNASGRDRDGFDRKHVAYEAADTSTSITSLVEWLGIGEAERQKAQADVNERNMERGRRMETTNNDREPWKPKNGELYYIPLLDDSNAKTWENVWNGYDDDMQAYENGIVCATRKDAEKLREEIIWFLRGLRWGNADEK